MFLIPDHEHIVALQQLVALAVEDIDVFEQRHLRWNVSRYSGHRQCSHKCNA
jgi:hypothetical protein